MLSRENDGQFHQFLDSLVVRISACHVEGPGSIPGRGEIFLSQFDEWDENLCYQARVAQSVER